MGCMVLLLLVVVVLLEKGLWLWQPTGTATTAPMAATVQRSHHLSRPLQKRCV
jgi:hypothetical protein